MAGSIFWQELSSSSIVTVSSAIGSVANNSTISAGTIDCRAAGTSGLIEKFVLRAEFINLWNVTSGVTTATVAFDMFLLPALDGTNYPDVDLGTGPGSLTGVGVNAYAGSFICNKAPTASTAMRFVGPELDLYPRLYTVYLTNRSGQTNVTSQLRVMADQIQYT